MKGEGKEGSEEGGREGRVGNGEVTRKEGREGKKGVDR